MNGARFTASITGWCDPFGMLFEWSYSLGTPAQLTDDHSMIRGHAVEGKNSPTGLHT